MSEQSGLRGKPARRQPGGGRPSPWAPQFPSEIAQWLSIAPDGMVTVFTGKVEVGQNIRTSLAQAVADELRVPLESVQLVMGDTDRVPFDMGTFGSMTTPVMATQFRKVAAAARQRLLECAAEHFGVRHEELTVTGGRVTHAATGRSLGFGELTGGQQLTGEIADDVATTPATEWIAAGISAPAVNGTGIVTGQHRYPSDVKQPGMLYGKILRPPALSARLVALDMRSAEALPGVQVVRDGDLVGIVAPDEPTAERALAALDAAWESAPLPGEENLYSYLETHPLDAEEGSYDGPVCEECGQVEFGLAAGKYRLRHTYTTAYIAHAPLETRAAVAEWHEGKLTVWTGTQRPFGVRSELALAFGIDEEDVRVIVPDTGSGYGGKHTGEVAREAACLARAAGAPVRLVWTREEEFTWAYMRPAAVIEIESAASADGALTGWECHNYNSGAQAIRPPYAIPHQRIAFHPADSPLRQGSYRALAATANTFARETHMDELAYAAGMDPLAFRLRNVQDSRLRAVLEAATERFGWGRRQAAAPGHGVGLAAGHEKGSYVATCAEVALEGPRRDARVVRVVQAFECGAVVNPDGLQNQIEGAIVQALGGALFEQVEIEQGRILTSGFARYRVPRFSDVPIIEIVLLDRKELPSTGAGETPIIGLAPAVGNAIFAATGMRRRSLPLAPHGLTEETAG